MDMINVSVIGSGYWGPNLIRNFADIESVKLMSVCDLKKDRLDYILKHYPATSVTTNYKDVLDDSSVDAVVIATHAATHYPLVKEALLSGKNVFVEKPLALKTSECKELIEIAEQRAKILMVGHTFIYNDAVKVLKDYIDNGDLGEIFYLYSQRLSLGRVRQDVNAMWNFAPHDVSIILYLLDEEPIQVSAKGLTYIQKGIEDVVFMNLDFPSGVSAHIHISWLDPQKIRKMTVVGSQKMIIYDDVDLDAKIQIYDKGVTRIPNVNSPRDFETFGEFQLLLRSGDVILPSIKFREPLANECKHFVDCIIDGKTPYTDGVAGLKVVKVLEAAQQSLDENGKTIKLY
jgi:predicted dehydrogenase